MLTELLDRYRNAVLDAGLARVLPTEVFDSEKKEAAELAARAAIIARADYATSMNEQAIEELNKKVAELEAEHERLQRTVQFQSEQYLAAHGGLWGECKYQQKVAELEARLSRTFGPVEGCDHKTTSCARCI